MGFYVRNYSGYNMGRFMALFPCVTENDRGCGSLFIFSPHILILIISPFAHRLQVFFPLSNSPLSFFSPTCLLCTIIWILNFIISSTALSSHTHLTPLNSFSLLIFPSCMQSLPSWQQVVNKIFTRYTLTDPLERIKFEVFVRIRCIFSEIIHITLTFTLYPACFFVNLSLL